MLKNILKCTVPSIHLKIFLLALNTLILPFLPLPEGDLEVLFNEYR